MGRLPFTYKDLIPFVEPLMDHLRDVEKLARLVCAILASGSARKSDWARHYRKEAGERTNYKAIERLMAELEPERLLHRLIDPGTPFVLVDPTEIPRPKATHTPYVGRLRTGGWDLGPFSWPSLTRGGRSRSMWGSTRRPR